MTNNKLSFTKNIIQISIKKGKKQLSEKTFRQSLINLSKSNNNLNLTDFFEETQINIQPLVKLQKKKYNYKPVFANDIYKQNQAARWLLNEIKKNNKKFNIALASELLAINNKTSNALANQLKLYDTALQAFNIKKN